MWKQGFAEADVIVERTYRTPMTEHAFMEPECSIAVPAGYDDDHDKADHLRGQPDSLQRPSPGGQESGPARTRQCASGHA